MMKKLCKESKFAFHYLFPAHQKLVAFWLLLSSSFVVANGKFRAFLGNKASNLSSLFAILLRFSEQQTKRLAFAVSVLVSVNAL